MNNEIQAVRDALMQQAKHMLTEAGEYRPFGVVMHPDGSLTALDADEAEQLKPVQLVAWLENHMREQLASGRIRVGGIGVDALMQFSATSAPTDALHMRVLHTDGSAADFFMTYRLTEDRLVCDPPFADEATFTLP